MSDNNFPPFKLDLPTLPPLPTVDEIITAVLPTLPSLPMLDKITTVVPSLLTPGEVVVVPHKKIWDATLTLQREVAELDAFNRWVDTDEEFY